MVTVERHPIGNLTKFVANATNANPVVITTTTPHGLGSTEQVLIAGILGTTSANGLWVITVLSDTTFSIPVAGNGAYISGGLVTREYVSLVQFEAAYDIDLVTADKQVWGEIYYDGSPLAEGGTITFAGATTDATRWRGVRAGPGHAYKPQLGTGARARRVGSGTFLEIAEANFRLGDIGRAIGLQVIDNTSSASTGVSLISGSVATRIDSVFVDMSWCYSPSVSGIDHASSAGSLECANAIVKGCGSKLLQAGAAFRSQAAGAKFVNCTAWGFRHDPSGRGFTMLGSGANSSVVNCIALDCHICFVGTSSFILSCVSGPDGTAAINGGFGGQIDTDILSNPDGLDFRSSYAGGEKVIDTGLVGSAHIAWLSHDFDGVPRGVTWGRGAYETFATLTPATPTTLVKSIGAGAGRDYASITAFLVASEKHLVAANEIWIGELYDDADYGSNPAMIVGAVSDATHYRVIRPAEGHAYSLATGQGITFVDDLDILDNYFRLEGAALLDMAAIAGATAVGINARGRGCVVDSMYVRDQAATNGRRGIVGGSTTGIRISNSIVQGSDGAGGLTTGIESDSEGGIVLNCAVWGVRNAAAAGNSFKGTSTFRNCIGAKGPAGEGSGQFHASAVDTDYCAATDATPAGLHSIKSIASATTIFVNPGTSLFSDFRLKPGSPCASLALALPVWIVEDFLGEPRTIPWDMGAIEGVAGSVPHKRIEQITSLRRATCWRWVRPDGSVHRFTDHNAQLIVAGEVYDPAKGMDAAASRYEGGLRESNRDARGIVSASVIDDDDLRSGKFNGSVVDERTVDWLYPWAGEIDMRTWLIAEVEWTGEEWRAVLVSLPHLLGRKTGKFWGRLCTVKLGEKGPTLCNKDISADIFSGVAVATVTKPFREFTAGGGLPGTYADDFYGEGKVIWLTGANAGLESEIEEFIGGATKKITLQVALPSPIQVGDTFVIEPGCRKRWLEDCLAKFANTDNFQGDPFVAGTKKSLQSPTS